MLILLVRNSHVTVCYNLCSVRYDVCRTSVHRSVDVTTVYILFCWSGTWSWTSGHSANRTRVKQNQLSS